jgi:hypothetical protein
MNKINRVSALMDNIEIELKKFDLTSDQLDVFEKVVMNLTGLACREYEAGFNHGEEKE